MLASLRQSLAKSSVGSLLATYRAAIQKDIQETFGGTVQDVKDGSCFEMVDTQDMLNSQAELSRPSLRRTRPVSVAGVKQTVAKIATRGRARASSWADSSKSVFSRILTDESVTTTVSSAAQRSCVDSTPPLTPDSTSSTFANSPQTPYPTVCDGFEPTLKSSTDDFDECYKTSRKEVRRGKRPERILVCKDAYSHCFDC